MTPHEARIAGMTNAELSEHRRMVMEMVKELKAIERTLRTLSSLNDLDRTPTLLTGVADNTQEREHAAQTVTRCWGQVTANYTLCYRLGPHTVDRHQ